MTHHAILGFVSAAFVLSVFLSVVASSQEQSLWFLEGSQRQPAEGALLEALRIYTRDLDVPITLRRIPGRVKSGPEHSLFAQGHCRSNATLVLWFDPAGAALHIWHCQQEGESTLPAPLADELSITAQTLALKVRGFLAESLMKPPGKNLTSPEGAANEVTASIPPKASTVNDRGGDPKEDKGSSLVGGQMPRQERGVEAGVAYFAGTISTRSGFRPGLAFRLGLVSLTLPVALEFEGILLGRVTNQKGGYRVVAREIPFSLLLAFHVARSRWTFSAGPRLGVHFLSTEGHSADGRSGAEQSLSLIMGLGEEIRYAVWRGWSLTGSFGETMVFPRQRFALDGQNLLQIGLFQWNFCLGVLYRL